MLWLPPNAAYALGDELFGEWQYEHRVLATGQLRISQRDDPFSVHLFRHEDGSFRGWYVNLERPQRRTALGFDFEDELLDVWCPLGGGPELLDEEELEEAVQRGIFSPEQAAEIRATAERVLADRPWPTGWEDWQPEPGWQLPELPPGWDALTT